MEDTIWPIRGLFGSASMPYKCDNCNKKFTEKSLLENHIEKRSYSICEMETIESDVCSISDI